MKDGNVLPVVQGGKTKRVPIEQLTGARALDRDDVRQGFAVPATDAAGRDLGLMVDGGYRVSYIDVPPQPAATDRDGNRRFPIAYDQARRVAIAVDLVTGKTICELADSTMKRALAWLIASGAMGSGGGYLAPSVLRADYSAYPMRIWPLAQTATYTYAQVQDRGRQTYRALERVAGTGAMALIEGSGRLDMVLHVGQSTAGKGGNPGVLDATPHWPSTVVSFNAGAAIHGDSLLDGSTLTDFAPLYDPAGAAGVTGPFPITMGQFALAGFRCEQGFLQKGTVCATAWQGSTPLNGFIPGTQNYTNAKTYVTRGHALAPLYGRTGVSVRKIVITCGESSTTDWAATFAQLKAGYDADVPTITGQTDTIDYFIWQTSTLPGSFNTMALGQNTVADGTAHAWMIGSMIDLPINYPADTIHPTALGQMKEGDREGHALLVFERTGAWNCTKDVSAVVTGSTVVITVQLAPDCVRFGRTLDRWSPPQVSQDGFRVVDGSADITVTSIDYAIVSRTTATITLHLASAPASGSAYVQYGLDWGGINGWADRTGNVGAETDVKSFWAARGFDVPPLVRHPLRRFKRTLTTS